jgi:hypothetical protein
VPAQETEPARDIAFLFFGEGQVSVVLEHHQLDERHTFRDASRCMTEPVRWPAG